MTVRVLQICNDYRDNNLYSNLFAEINNYVEDQIVFVPFKRQLDFKSMCEYEVIHSVCYSNMDRLFFKNKSNKIYKSLKGSYDLNEIEIVHAHTLFSNGIIAYKVKQEYNKEYIVSIRGTDVEVFFKKMVHLRNLGIKIMLNAKKIIFVSVSIKRNLLAFIKDDKVREMIEANSIVITNGVDDFWLDNLHERVTLNKKIEILQVGWINKNKNQLNSFKAIEILNDNGFDCSLTIIGGVEYQKHKKYNKILHEYILKSRYKGKIRFLNRMNKEDLIGEFRKCDVFMMPSLKETFGLVFIEALSQGLPIIYSKNQGVDGLFDENRVGVAVQPKNPKEIANGLMEVFGNYEELAGNIKLHINNFQWNNISKQIINTYKNINN
jgi:glycosyltransferase involved in cell wall biosynthesis